MQQVTCPICQAKAVGPTLKDARNALDRHWVAEHPQGLRNTCITLVP